MNDATMRKKAQLLCAALLCAAALMSAQAAEPHKGIRFEQGLSWEQVKEKAKAQNKYIFVDAIATWCVPCKEMDEHVYSTEPVGTFFNDKFISVKIQFDKTPQDSEAVRQWYATAEALQLQYAIQGFPSYLFFSPEGTLVQKARGMKKLDEFLRLAGDSVDPSKQYPTLLANYKQGKLQVSELPGLARMAQQSGDPDTANAIARDYKAHLQQLSEEALLTKEHLQFISDFAGEFLLPEGSQGKFFSLVYKHADRIDGLLEQKGRSQGLIDWIVHKEELADKLSVRGKPVTNNPNWKAIRAAISKKYGDSYAERLVPPAQLSFYKEIKDWPKYAELVEEKIRKSPPTAEEKGVASDSWFLNIAAWDIFEGSHDKRLLAKALRWIELSIKLDEAVAVSKGEEVNEQILDTKASILQKLGRVEEAVAVEEQAIAVLQRKKAENHPLFAELSERLAKMKSGEPTWPIN